MNARRLASVTLTALVLGSAGPAASASDAKTSALTPVEHQKLVAALNQIEKQLAPLREKALHADPALAKLHRQLTTARFETYREEGRLIRRAEQALAKSRPDLSDTIRELHALEQKAGQLAEETRGQGAVDAQQQLLAVQPRILAIRRAIGQSLRQLIDGTADLRSAQLALRQKREKLRQGSGSLDEQLDARVGSMGPQAKQLLMTKRKIQDRLRTPSPASSPKIKQKGQQLAQLQARIAVLDRQLQPVRLRVQAQDSELKALRAEYEQRLHSKMTLIAPEFRKAIAERQKLQKRVDELWQSDRPRRGD